MNDPRAITLFWRSQSAVVVSTRDLLSERPALLITISTPPKARLPAAIAPLIAFSSVTSTPTATALSGPPSSVATFCAPAKSRSATTTQEPSATSRVAIALPIPDAAPVTSAILPTSALPLGARRSLASSNSQYSIRNFSDSLIGW